MLISSVLLVQADEGVSFLVVDRIGDIYRNLPRRADVIVTTVGARHKCQQRSARLALLQSEMASSFYTHTLHVDFESFLVMDNPGMVSVFNALMASGLEGFLGCTAVLYEAALVDFFENGSVRDGLVVITVNGEPVSTSGKKSQMKIEYRLLCDIMAKTISVKAGSFNAITTEKFLMLTEIVCGWFDLPCEDIFAQMDADRPFVTPSDTDEEMETIGAGTDVGEQQLHSFVTADSMTDAPSDYFVEEPEEVEMSDDEQSVDEMIDADEAMSLEDILLSIPVDVLLPSAGVDFTKIILTKDIKFLELMSGPGIWPVSQIPVDDKGKETLMDKDPVKGNPVKEQFLLILAYIECLVQLRQMNFAPGDDSSVVDLKILDWLTDLHLFVLEELKDQSLAHGLRWEKTCCTKIFEGRTRDRCAVIARSNTNTKSSCWIRTMLRVDGTWVIEPCADYWKPI
ncbi:hypothetical protein F511_23367 [Dorcoceras hygrometricum]|uniref:Uncharacterized protein n=1 Tax=Dorcoceras hygrometricum TaxID=472368 RepID=A0A2Z7BRB6_9LAMI|nr:hypothetical protein F511_23367 [Dorcoceras hygrometricum]